MSTLEKGVESLQKEKRDARAATDEAKQQCEAHQRNLKSAREQIDYLNERNATLSKKCVEILDVSKAHKER